MPDPAAHVLFVCTKFGGRSVLAAHLFNQFSPVGLVAVAASFDPGQLPSTYFTFLKSLGYEVPSRQPKSLFEHFKTGCTFRHVIMMCSPESGEQCRIFRISVNELYGKEAQVVEWSVPDLSLIRGAREDVRDGFMQVIEQVEARVKSLIVDIVSQSDNGAAGSSKPAA